MQTFLPYPCFVRSVKCLDYKRLGKQRVEAFQLLNTLRGKSTGWVNHPACRMWKGYENALQQYMNVCIIEWIKRGYNNTMECVPVFGVVLPDWLGLEQLHKSHRSNLLRKDSKYYSKFGWKESDALPYYWPVEKGTVAQRQCIQLNQLADAEG